MLGANDGIISTASLIVGVAVVAIGGLIAGTFLTLLIVPVLLFLLLKRCYPETKATPVATSST